MESLSETELCSYAPGEPALAKRNRVLWSGYISFDFINQKDVSLAMQYIPFYNNFCMWPKGIGPS